MQKNGEICDTSASFYEFSGVMKLGALCDQIDKPHHQKTSDLHLEDEILIQSDPFSFSRQFQQVFVNLKNIKNFTVDAKFIGVKFV